MVLRTSKREQREGNWQNKIQVLKKYFTHNFFLFIGNNWVIFWIDIWLKDCIYFCLSGEEEEEEQEEQEQEGEEEERGCFGNLDSLRGGEERALSLNLDFEWIIAFGLITNLLIR